ELSGDVVSGDVVSGDVVSGEDPDLPARMMTAFTALESRLEADPEVVAVTFADVLPAENYPPRQVEVQRGTEPPTIVDTKLENDQVLVTAVDAGFFDAFRVPVIAGRAFHTGDAGSAHAVVIINESLANSI